MQLREDQDRLNHDRTIRSLKRERRRGRKEREGRAPTRRRNLFRPVDFLIDRWHQDSASKQTSATELSPVKTWWATVFLLRLKNTRLNVTFGQSLFKPLKSKDVQVKIS